MRRPLQASSSESRARVPHRQPSHVHAARDSALLVALVLARRRARRATTSTPCSTAKAPTCTLERPVSRRRRARWSTTTRRSITPMPHCTQPRGLQGHPRRHGARASSTARSSCARTRRRPTPSRPTARCCSPTTRTIDTKPQLEIFADDVKCTHGATVGQLDEDAMFYLRARGLDATPRRATC